MVSLQSAVHRCILENDVDLKSMMLNNIILCGGTTLAKGLPQRLQLELSTLLTGGFKMKFTTQLTQGERKNATWIGGSILSSLSAFAPSWIYKSEYEEFGNSILNRKLL
jgi:actin-related protein